VIRARKLAAFLALACVAVQLASGSALLASAVALALHADGHDHSVSVSADEAMSTSCCARRSGSPACRRRVGPRRPSVAERDHVSR
jgi:hypothetical protein